jgi:hypothetical protein
VEEVKVCHHIRGAEIAAEFLKSFALSPKEVELIRKCVLNHRNLPYYKPKSLEEKIVAVADTLSHFKSVFYFSYFKTRPGCSFADMARDNLRELEQDWRDFLLLPKSKELVAEKYLIIKEMMEAFRP